MSDFIPGLTENKLKHSLGVARKCYSLAKKKGLPESTAQKFWLMGFLHDVGYEFSNSKEEHPQVGAYLLESFIKDDVFISVSVEAIRQHGALDSNKNDLTLKILNLADMTINSKGDACTVTERLDDIAYRFGKDSEVYKVAETVVSDFNLLRLEEEFGE